MNMLVDSNISGGERSVSIVTEHQRVSLGL